VSTYGTVTMLFSVVVVGGRVVVGGVVVKWPQSTCL